MLGESYPLAGLLCLFGLFLHIALSDPLLNSLGFTYSGDEGKFYQKVHPGTYFIFLSLIALLWSHGNPLRQAYRIYKEYSIFSALLLLYVMFFIYATLRTGAAGMAFLIDTHMTAPICAIVLSYTPISYCRRAAYFIMGVALLNSVIGICESIGKFRIFTFDSRWVVLKENYFRASALRGHPLNNAMFTSVLMFVAMGLRYPAFLKAVFMAIFLTSLVAFGGRIALLYGIAGTLVLGVAAVRHKLKYGHPTLLQTLLILSLTLTAPVVLAGGLYLALDSSMGERIATHAKWDASADARGLALHAFQYMTPQELVFGASTNRIVDIAYRMNLTIPLSDIENPWLLMYMYMGILVFPVWLATTLLFIWRLMKNQPLALQMAVVAYFTIASTSNSFGRKDSTYLIMVSAVICAARSLTPKRSPA